ncbi:hypothetical protein DHD80_08105 [Gramella sp. AN32]|nr:hypothetical protein [Gramella sp. AN32]
MELLRYARNGTCNKIVSKIDVNNGIPMKSDNLVITPKINKPTTHPFRLFMNQNFLQHLK